MERTSDFVSIEPAQVPHRWEVQVWTIDGEPCTVGVYTIDTARLVRDGIETAFDTWRRG